MTRPKTISDEAIVDAARRVFRSKGHAATTREISAEAGISEGILYQRFGNKDELFFAAMLPTSPDIEELLGPERPDVDAPSYMTRVLCKLEAYFSDVIPLALHVLTHPSFDHATLGRAMAGAARVHEGLARRLEWFEGKKQIRKSTSVIAAKMLVSLAHDAALSGAPHGSELKSKELEAMAQLLWNGVAPPTNPARNDR